MREDRWLWRLCVSAFLAVMVAAAALPFWLHSLVPAQ